MLSKATLALLLAVAPARAAQAQQVSSENIIVIGRRQLFGIAPERTLGEQDISAYGVSDVGELLNEVTRENGETADEPVILVNGKPISNRNEIAHYPAEAVSQVQVLPRGSATKVGGSPNRRVYNIVLKKNADVRIARAAVRTATEGGWSSRSGELTYTKVNGDKRLNGALTVRNDDALLESDRDVIEPAGSPIDLGRFRTLQPSINSVQLSVSAADRLAPWLTGTVTGKLGSNGDRSLHGLDPYGDLLGQRGRTRTANLDFALNADSGPWLISFVGDYQYGHTRTSIDGLLTGDPTGLRTSETTAVTSSASSSVTATGPLLALAAGPVQLTFAGAIARDSIEARALGGSSRFVKLEEDVTGGLDVPLASRTSHFLAPLGELTATIQFRRSHVSHFGSLSSQTFALTWQPMDWVRLFGSVTRGQTPPDIELLGGAVLETPGIVYFDPARNETVSVTEVSGGNPDLSAPREANRRLTANVKPSKKLPLELSVEYSSVRNRGIVTALPPASALIFAAFPDRFIRDPNGVLTTVDIRPIQLAKEDQEQLRYGINLTLPLGRSGTQVVAPTTHADPAASSGGGAGASSDIPASAHPRLQFNLSYTQLLKSRLEIAPGTSTIDLLSRYAVGLGGIGRPRHEVDLSLGYAERGMGIRLAGQYRSATYLNLGEVAGMDALRFSPLASFTLKSWLEPSRFTSAKWLRSTRLTLSVVNIADRRQSVRNSAGATPLAYQSVYRDPIGRTVELELRKQF